MRNLIKAIEVKLFQFSIKNLFLFAVIWFMVGFSLGTATLMGPVRWVTEYTRNSNMDSSVENWAVRIVILLFIFISFNVSILLLKGFDNSSSTIRKIVIIVSPLLLTVFSLWLWLNPKMMQFNSVQTSESFENIEFIFGPYPEEDKIIELKKQNVSGIISLLHEAVIPFEPKLLADESALAIKHGVKLIHLPMLPWVSSNENSLNEVRRIAIEGNGKYYVHCYLGKDRVGVVRKAIKEILGEERISGEVRKRNIDDKKRFERGEIIKLDDGIYFSPFPTDEEFFSYLLSGSFENVVSLLTPENPEDIPWIEKEEKILVENGINYKLLPLNLNPYEPSKLMEYIGIIKKLKKPVLVHSFLTPSPQSEIFISTFNSGIPALPEYIFSLFMNGGKVSFYKPNVAFGPQPFPHEFEGYLYERGIRVIGFVGKVTKEILELKKLAEEANIEWVNISDTNYELLENDGPWYLFGENVEKIIKSIQ